MPQPESQDAQGFDVAVLGASPFALLLAGMLASRYGRRVVLAGERFSALRLPASLGLGVGAFTRPETWDLMAGLEAETAALLAKAGAAPKRLDITLIAERDSTVERLGHIRYIVAGLHRKAVAARDRKSLTFPASLIVDEAALHPAIDEWLTSLGVTRIEDAAPAVSPAKRGPGTIAIGGRPVPVSQIILADDNALHEYLTPAQFPSPLRALEATAILTSAIRAPHPGVALHLDRRVAISTRGPAILAHVAGITAADARLARALEGYLPLVKLAARKLRLAETRDGAPLIGWLKEPRLFIAAGLGVSAPLFAPLVARAIAGEPTDAEKAWLDPRSPAQSATRTAIAEVGHDE